jgi:undecaprenyl-diphosphatase
MDSWESVLTSRHQEIRPESNMALIRIPVTGVDRWVANAIAANTNVRAEHAAEVLTWGADEHLLCLIAAGWWIYCRGKEPTLQQSSTHFLATTVASSLLPHVLKALFEQERPDRTTLSGHMRGIPLSGKKYDAFPSGHALHMGALASAARELPPKWRNTIWALSAGLVTTRVILLAHWVSDVAAGMVMGAAMERGIRIITRYRRFQPKLRN